MLASIRIQNIAIAESLEIELEKGLNILTGETGAGKSIILKSIDLLCGKRASANIIRSGSTKAIVEGIFLLDQKQLDFLFNEFEELEDSLNKSESEFLIKRIIDSSGRSKFYINGSLFNQNIISKITSYLVEVTGQNDQTNLREASNHLEILDSYGTNSKILDEVKIAYLKYKEKRDHILKLSTSKEELILKLERLKFIHEELKKLNLKTGEKDALIRDIERVKHLDKIREGLEECLLLLDGTQINDQSDEYSNSGNSRNKITPSYAISRITSIANNLSTLDPSILDFSQTAQQTLTLLSELNSQATNIQSKLNFDPETFEIQQTRLALINQMERKYNKNSEDLISYLNQISDELLQYEGNFFDEKKAKEELNKLEEDLKKVEEKLTKERIKIGKQLSKAVTNELADLSLQNARFEIKIDSKDSSADGADKITFNFSANPGEPLQSLEKVASGGELSRLQLILKSLCINSTNKALLVFDEIDTGVSGAVSQIVGEKLLKLSKNSQTIVITHSAQVAALADKHILVEKEVIENRTYSKVSYLDDKSRINVIAAMLAGKNISNDFINSASQLLGNRESKG